MLQQVHVWNDDNHSEAVEMWGDGKSMKQIADHFSISRGAVSGYISRNRDVFPPRNTETQRVTRGRVHSAWTEARIDAASILWTEGVPTDEIANRFGVTTAALSDIVRRFRVRFPKRHRVEKRKAIPVDVDALFEEIEATSNYDSRRYQRLGFEPASFASLKARECRFPLTAADEPASPEMRCCAAPIYRGSYCGAHYAVAYRGRA